MSHRVHIGDVAEVIPTLGGPFDAVLCDPPYGLNFMARDWDHSVPGPAVWRVVLDALRPGASIMAFGGTRTFHRLVCAVEDAGAEIRDVLMWLYLSGFPKNHDISKAIDKLRDDEDEIRTVCRYLRARIAEHDTHTVVTLAEHFGFHRRMIEHWAASEGDSQPTCPTVEQWLELTVLLDLDDDEIAALVFELNDRKGEFGAAWHQREITGTTTGGTGAVAYSISGVDEYRRDKGATEEAKRWEGYGSALKPSYEPLILAMKQRDGSFANNATEHGVAGLNIDAGRVGTETVGWGGGAAGGNTGNDSNMGLGKNAEPRPVDGRWPANVIMDEGAGALLDSQSGELSGSTGVRDPHGSMGYHGGAAGLPGVVSGYDDSGGASRIFYCPKASKAEREAGLDTFRKTNVNDGRDTPIDNAYQRGDTKRRNTHPTVKPVDLCRYLAAMLLPPPRKDGNPRRLLVPFSGSGSEMIGGLLAGWDEVVGVELSEEYAEIAQARLAHWQEYRCAQSDRAEKEAVGQRSLLKLMTEI